MPLASSALLPSVPGTLPATHVVSSHSFILVGTDLKHWKISIKKTCGRSIGFPGGADLQMVWAKMVLVDWIFSGLVLVGCKWVHHINWFDLSWMQK